MRNIEEINEMFEEYKEIAKNAPKAHIKVPGQKVHISSFGIGGLERMTELAAELVNYEDQLDISQEEISDLRMRAGKLNV